MTIANTTGRQVTIARTTLRARGPRRLALFLAAAASLGCGLSEARAGSIFVDFESGAPAGSLSAGDATVLDPGDPATTQVFDGATTGDLPPAPQTFTGGGTTFVSDQRNLALEAQVLSAPAMTGDFLRLSHATNNNRNTIAFDRVSPVESPHVTATYDFRITPGAGQADGLGFMLLDTTTWGTTGAGPDYNGEAPDEANSFGFAIDIHQGGGEPNNNHTSLHWNGSQVGGSVNGAPGFDMSNGVIHQAQLDVEFIQGGANVTVDLVEDIGGASTTHNIYTDFFIAGMEPYSMRAGFGARTGGQNADFDLDNVSVTQEAGIDDNVLRLTTPTLNSAGGFALPELDAPGYDVPIWITEFDFRVDPEDNSDGADGFSAAFVRNGDPLGTLGETGGTSGVAIEFDTHNNGLVEVSGNHIQLNYDGADISGEINLDGILTLESGLIHHARISNFNGHVIVTFTPAGGTPTVVLDEVIAGFVPYDGRLNLAGRTGGLNEATLIDNLSLVTIPEPSSLLLVAAGVAGLAGCRRRRRKVS